MYKNRCYSVMNDDTYNFNQSLEVCQEADASLAIVPDAGTLTFIQENLPLEDGTFYRVYLHTKKRSKAHELYTIIVADLATFYFVDLPSCHLLSWLLCSWEWHLRWHNASH